MILGIDGRLANDEHPAGAGRYCREVIRALVNMAHGMTLRVYLDAPPCAALPVPRENIQLLPGGRFWTHRVLGAELRRDPPDVFFSPVAQLPLGCPCPALVTVLDLAAWSHPGSFPWGKQVMMRLQARYAIARAAHIIAISQCTASDLACRFRIPESRVSVAHLGCGEHFFDPPAPDPGTIVSTLPERYVLYLGQVQPRKNLLRLIEAFGRVLARYPDLPHHLVLAGGLGWKNDAIFKAAMNSPVGNRIQFLDYLPEIQVPILVARADVLALVSLWEGFGLPALEAMAAGTAVLASNCSSLPEVVGDAGILVDPEDMDAIANGLARVLLDDECRRTCVEKGRERARLFRWENTARVIMKAAKAIQD